jgi:hypothetical protein
VRAVLLKLLEPGPMPDSPPRVRVCRTLAAGCDVVGTFGKWTVVVGALLWTMPWIFFVGLVVYAAGRTCAWLACQLDRSLRHRETVP